MISFFCGALHLHTGLLVAAGGGRTADQTHLRPIPPAAGPARRPIAEFDITQYGASSARPPHTDSSVTVSYTGPARTAAHPPAPQHNAITSDIYQQPNRFSGSTSPWPPLFLNY